MSTEDLKFNPKMLGYLINKSYKSKQEVVRELGISEPQLYRWLNGEFEPNEANLKTLAEYFNVSEKDLCSDDVPEYREKHFSPKMLGFIIETYCHFDTFKSLSNKIGYSSKQLSNWVGGVSTPKSKTVDKLAEYFNLDRTVFYLEDVLSDIDEDLESYIINAVKKKALESSSPEPASSTIPVVPRTQFHHLFAKNPDWQPTDVLQIPFWGNSKVVALEVPDDNMKPTFLPSDFVLCTPAETDKIQPGKTYCVVTDRQVGFYRLYPLPDFISCHSDNRVYEPFTIKELDIRQLFQCIGLLRLNIQKPE